MSYSPPSPGSPPSPINYNSSNPTNRSFPCTGLSAVFGLIFLGMSGVMFLREKESDNEPLISKQQAIFGIIGGSLALIACCNCARNFHKKKRIKQLEADEFSQKVTSQYLSSTNKTNYQTN